VVVAVVVATAVVAIAVVVVDKVDMVIIVKKCYVISLLRGW
jgi:hypothetical protein